MTDWLGMAVHPRSPHPELKARVLGRALERRRWIAPLAAAALLVILAGGGSAYWASRTIRALSADRDTLSARLAALQDTVNTFIHGTETRLVQVPVSTGGRLGAVTIFADDAHHRWLVRCDGLAPNEPDQAYQLWFITDKGMKTAAIMPMDQDRPMVMALEMPTDHAQVMGAAMSIEPRAGSAEPRGPMVFHRLI